MTEITLNEVTYSRPRRYSMPAFSNWQLDTFAINRAKQSVGGAHRESTGWPLVFLSGQLCYFLLYAYEPKLKANNSKCDLVLSYIPLKALINPSDSNFRLKNESETGITFPSGPFLNPYPDLEQNWVILTEFQHNSQFVRSQSHTHTHWLKLRD